MEEQYISADRSRFKKVKKTSLFLEMRDGIELAIDVWLPQGLESGEKLPTLLHQTRYWRGAALRWPFSMLGDGLLGHEGGLVRELILSGYAFVNVDCRGSGASFGTRPHPWSPDEVKDGNEVIDWILKQEWSNQDIGLVGISYTGTSAEFAMSNQHPAVKAAMPLFSLYDVYDDIALPGGIPHDGFVIEWGKANAVLDSNRIPVKDPLIKILVKGVSPVGKGKAAKLRLEEAVEAHKHNRNVHESSVGVEYRDQQPASKVVVSMDDFSPHFHKEAIGNENVAVLSASGWMDGAYPHSAIKRWLNLPNRHNRLLIGPWDHGGKNHITPGKHRKLRTDIIHFGIRFFDHYLKGYQTSIAQEPAVKYYTLQEEKWKTAEKWPPEGTISTPYFLQPNNSLTSDGNSLQADSYLIQHNPLQGTGHYTRWRGLRMSLKTGNLYPDRKKRDEILACFDSAPLPKDIEVTGHPIVNLFVKTNETDGAFFVYLEDINPGGEVRYVTEGELRAIHRKISSDTPPYKDVVPYHSYLKADAAPIPAWQVVKLEFDMLPTSYLFKKGHKIRIAIGTGDRDNFKEICRPQSQYEIQLGGEFATRVDLPIMPKK